MDCNPETKTESKKNVDNKQLEAAIVELITLGMATNKASLATTIHHDVADIERALERLKRRGAIRYNGPTRSWDVVVEQGAKNVTVASSPSAPAVESLVQLDNNNQADKPPTKETSMDTNKIDAAINAARKKRGDKPAGEMPSADKAARPRLSAEQKAERDEAKATERAAKKLERDAVRAEKQKAKQADRKPAHMSKVEKAATKLPKLDDKVQSFFNELTVNFSAAQLSSLASHVQHFNRVKATERALDQKVTTGAQVRITGGDNRFLGMVGTVEKCQRIRCYVAVEGAKKPVYLFTSDVEVIAEASAQVASTG